MPTKRTYDIKSLERRFGPMTLGMFVRAMRESEGVSQSTFARKLKISRANLCDIEKERKNISASRAEKIAKILDVPEHLLVQLAIQDTLKNENLNYIVKVRAA